MSSYSFQTRAHHKEDYLLRRTTKLLVQMQYCLNTFKFYEIQNNLPLLLVFIVDFRDITLERVDVISLHPTYSNLVSLNLSVAFSHF